MVFKRILMSLTVVTALFSFGANAQNFDNIGNALGAAMGKALQGGPSADKDDFDVSDVEGWTCRKFLRHYSDRKKAAMAIIGFMGSFARSSGESSTFIDQLGEGMRSQALESVYDACAENPHYRVSDVMYSGMDSLREEPVDLRGRWEFDYVSKYKSGHLSRNKGYVIVYEKTADNKYWGMRKQYGYTQKTNKLKYEADQDVAVTVKPASIIFRGHSPRYIWKNFKSNKYYPDTFNCNKGHGDHLRCYSRDSNGTIGVEPVTLSRARPQRELSLNHSRWKTNYGPLLMNSPDEVNVYGKYHIDRNGSVWGTVSGNKFVGYWAKDHAGKACHGKTRGTKYWGRLTFTFNDDGESFRGLWSYCNKKPTSKWNGDRRG